jgi:hypothetical protein
VSVGCTGVVAASVYIFDVVAFTIPAACEGIRIQNPEVHGMAKFDSIMYYSFMLENFFRPSSIASLLTAAVYLPNLMSVLRTTLSH